jgi:hypothetical protein
MLSAVRMRVTALVKSASVRSFIHRSIAQARRVATASVGGAWGLAAT